MTSQPIRDPVADCLITPENSLFVLIDYQPEQLAAVKSIDHEELVKNAVSTTRTVKTFGVPLVHSTRTRGELGWSPTHQSLVDEFRDGSYLARQAVGNG